MATVRWIALYFKWQVPGVHCDETLGVLVGFGKTVFTDSFFVPGSVRNDLKDGHMFIVHDHVFHSVARSGNAGFN